MERKNKEHQNNKNQKQISQLLSLLIIASFYIIKISYNGTLPTTIIKNVWITIKNFNFENLLLVKEGVMIDLLWISSFILISSIGLIVSSFMNWKKAIIIFVCFFLLNWIFIFFNFHDMIEIGLFFRSSIFFLIFSGIAIVNLFIPFPFNLRKKY